MENSKHTEGELKVSDEGRNGIFIHVNQICSPALAKIYTNNDIVKSREQALANAERIVKAVNGYDEALSALRTAEHTLTQLNVNSVAGNTLQLVKNAIQKLQK